MLDNLKLFTFHYVSISTTIVATIEHININLHSTMYLFQPVLSDRDRYLVLIYIPLCIYFNENNSLMTRNGSSIYIPLCIYFNRTKDFKIIINIEIYIPLCIYFNNAVLEPYSLLSLYLHSTMYLFQPNRTVLRPVADIHLHSTMYLFQL